MSLSDTLSIVAIILSIVAIVQAAFSEKEAEKIIKIPQTSCQKFE